MTEFLDIYESEHLTNVSNYSGVYEPLASYEKFDFVYNTGDGLVYYARQDMVQGGAFQVQNANRFSFDPNGPVVDGSETYYIYDELNVGTEGEFSVGQNIYISGTLNDSDGNYNIIGIEKNVQIPIEFDDENDVLSVLEANFIGTDYVNSSWFFRANLGEQYELDYPNLYLNSKDRQRAWHYLFRWIYISLLNNGTKSFWFYHEKTSIWFYASKQALGTIDADSNSFLYIGSEGDGSLGPEGWTYWIAPGDLGDTYSAIVYNYTNENFYGMLLNSSFEQIDPQSIDVFDGNPDVLVAEKISDIAKTRIHIKSIDQSSSVKQYEPFSDNLISINTLNNNIDTNQDYWTNNNFFFDADYGSTVSFRANNHKYEYGNGYYILQPKNINSLTFEADLKFKNRTNKEANAIMHFLENHQGQHEQDRPSSNLKYSQGISGFRWDGSSTFHPYDNTEVQTKKFYCQDFSHSLNFENSNDLTVKFRNLDSSVLRKKDGLFVDMPDEYSSEEYYEKNDIVYSPLNKQYYYWSGESTEIGKAPVEAQSSWSRENGYFKDTNTEYWARQFFWKPSIGLNVTQKPRLNEIALGAGYTQLYNDGINEGLLTLDLQFNNRADDEALAILHFLEQHMGYRPFSFVAPAPYNREQNFVCQEWSHTYNYKNNHSISAKFEQYPFNLSAEKHDNNIGPAIESDAELIFSSPTIIKAENEGEDLALNTPMRGKILLKNIGDKALNLYSATITSDLSSGFRILGQRNNNVPIVKSNPDYRLRLPPGTNLNVGSISLNNKSIKLRKGFTEGLEGGYMFDLIDSPGGTFIQYNNGIIRNILTKEILQTDYFINELFIQNNSENGTNTLAGGEEGYIEVVFRGLNSSDISETDESSYYTAELTIESSTRYSPQVGEVKVYVTIE